ncbi:MAG: hypothetical protein Q8T13_01795 [Acidobacteriota bacterium]|nr:hypothetical protein [Acidobacteriota bacterium]
MIENQTEPPIACTLEGESYPERIAWIADLAREGLRSHRRDDLTLELDYAPEVAGRVHEMVRKEQECCAFLSFDITDRNNAVRLTITAPGRARDVADDLFEQFLPTSASCSVPAGSADRS